MLPTPENVRQVILQLVPASIFNEITSYVFYDNHPRDEKEIDIIVCTKMGEVREYFNRELLSSVNLQRTIDTSEIKILRNSKCDLFYLVAIGGDLTILSRSDKLEVHQKLANVTKYEINDDSCSGKSVFKVETKFCDGPLVPDDNFENFKYLDYVEPYSPSEVDLQLPIIQHLMEKVTESRHTAEIIKQTYKNFLEIRQSIAFATYKSIHPNLDDSAFKEDPSLIAIDLKIHFEMAWIKSCNKKIIIAYNIQNGNTEYLEDVYILIHGKMRSSLEYTTKIFETIDVPPFWKQTEAQILRPYVKSALVVVINTSEMKDNVLSKVEFDGVLVFKKSDIECTVPIDNVNLSSLDVMGEQFDALCTDTMDDNFMLAVLASTDKIDLIMRHIKQETYIKKVQDSLTMDIFCKYLQMERIPNAENIVAFKKSPYHVLNGVMIILNKKGKDYLDVTVYSRTSSQVLALIHLVHDAVPFSIVTTTPTYKVIAKNRSLSIADAIVTRDVPYVYNYKGYAGTILDRTAFVLNYLDNCMIHMCESKNTAIRNKIGKEIDLFAQGKDGYTEFKDKMWTEASKGMKLLREVLISDALSSEDISMELSDSN